MAFDVLIAVCLTYVILLFAVAFVAERRARAGRLRFLRSPLVYTLSLSIYCTAWTFYGAVGYAARSGLEFATIYLGPTLVFVGWWWILRKLVRIGRTHRVTSIADLISSRYGKSNGLGIIVTVISVVVAAPYISLQLQSVTLSFGVFAGHAGEGALPDPGRMVLWLACGLALFTVLFGTRNLDANERHHGVVMAIAVEAVVKLAALLAVGVFVVWGLAGGPVEMFAQITAAEAPGWALQPGRFAGLTFVSAAAVLTLPRMFQVLVVENVDERHLATASWAFPAYLMGMCLFVVPIAVMGLARMPEANPDLFVLTLPLAEGHDKLALLAFLGGFSSATSMVIVAAIALATMVSNHIVTPLWLALRRSEAPDVRGVVLISRRLSIAGVLALGYGYNRLSGGGDALAAIGLIAFVGVAQVLPTLLGGIFWRGATRIGATAGLLTGFAIWLYTLFLPSVGGHGLLPETLMTAGPFGLSWLRPQALFGLEGMDALVHAMVWSLLLNTLAFLAFSLLSFPGPLERLQGVAFVNVFDHGAGAKGWARGQAEAEDLLSMAQRILGGEAAQEFFQSQSAAQGKAGFLPDPTPVFLARLERELAGSVGAATAHAMMAQLTGGTSVSMQDLIAVAGEAAEIKEHSSQLQAKSEELARTARALGEANDKLTEIALQKDAFLGQVSHELRTPMTSIRAFSEILMEPGLPEDVRAQYAGIIHEEARRLTRLLDELVDLSVLENRRAQLTITPVNLHDLIRRAIQSASSTRPERDFRYDRDPAREQVMVLTDADRLVQVFINLISNARKYCDADPGVLRIETRRRGGRLQVDFIDNGTGIARRDQRLVFEKFSRLEGAERVPGAGLGLAICREIMGNLGGSIDYLPGQGGAAFRVVLPLRRRDAAKTASGAVRLNGS
jgi:Na+/proline symporter/nitrogen-specific signal transduction histidine kinase